MALSGLKRLARISAMTLCAAAVCDSGDSIACIWDEQMTSTESSGEVLSKAARVNFHWLLLFAGEDIKSRDPV